MNIIDNLEILKKLKNPPKQLFYKGNLNLLNKTKVAIVGSRKMSVYTKELTINLAKALNKRGICIVSGAAIGVDAVAQSVACPNTIAVFGNGLDQIYPKQNEKLIKDIYQNALALSEYQSDFVATKYSFVQRNRVVVALSQALIVTQADIKSGSMQSVKFALELKIPIFVLPQRLNESLGTNELLQNGQAKLICDFDKFADSFAKEKTLFCDEFKTTQKDKILEFIKTNNDLQSAIDRFGDEVYEYELLGKVRINGMRIFIN